MTIELQGGNARNPIAKCDYDDCPNRLGKEDLEELTGFGEKANWQPHGRTGWLTFDSPEGPRHYCAKHAR